MRNELKAIEHFVISVLNDPATPLDIRQDIQQIVDLEGIDSPTIKRIWKAMIARKASQLGDIEVPIEPT